MLIGYTGPGSSGKDGEILHRFIASLFEDCDVRITPPDILYDSTHYLISRSKDGENVECYIKGWDLESIIDDLRVEMKCYAVGVMEELAGDISIDIKEPVEKFRFMMEALDRLRKANKEIANEVTRRYMEKIENKENK